MAVQHKEVDQFEEIIGAIPERALRRYGLMILLLVALVGLVVSFLKIAEKINTDITITALNPPVELSPSTPGIVKDLFVKDKIQVEKDQVLAHIEAEIDLEDIELIEKSIPYFATYRRQPEQVLNMLNGIGHLEGEIEIPIVNLAQHLEKYIRLLADPLYKDKRSILEEQLVYKRRLQELLVAEFNSKTEEKDTEASQHEINSKLYDSSIISRLDYLRSKKQLISTESILKRQQTDLERNKAEMEEIKANVQTLEIEYKKELRQIEDKIDDEIKGLKTMAHGMEHTYRLESPIAGLLEYVDALDRGQSVKQADVLFVVTPASSQVIGRMSVPEINTANLHIGKKVRVKLQKYPFKDWGMLEGRIYAITNIPIEGKYRVKVKFPKGFLTTYGKRISEANQLEGKAEIILSKKTIFYHLFNQFNSALDQMKD